MSSHRPFRHLQHKLGAKEGSGVKLTIWLPIIKSQELTRPWCAHGECDTPLESSQGELQGRFRPRPNRRSEQRVTTSWSPESPNRDNFGAISGLPLGNPGSKSHSGVGCGGVTQKILYGGRWWLPPSPGRGESSEYVLPVACPNTKNGSEGVLTNLLVGFLCKIE
jgi:hypothetical protein